MKSKLSHICFIIDESGSMYGSENDVVGGYKKLVSDQAAVEDGECLVSLYTFSSGIDKHYIGKNVKDLPEFFYSTGGSTALYDAFCIAVDEIGQWLSDMDESERPETNLVVVITDGYENFSRKFTLKDVKDRIEHQESKYNWKFMYLGADLASAKDANDMNFRYKAATTKADLTRTYSAISSAVKLNRVSGIDIDTVLNSAETELNSNYEKASGIKFK